MGYIVSRDCRPLYLDHINIQPFFDRIEGVQQPSQVSCLKTGQVLWVKKGHLIWVKTNQVIWIKQIK